MTESTAHGMSTALASKVHDFGDTLASEDIAQFERLAREWQGPGEVQGYAASDLATFELPEALKEKLLAFASTLAPEERTALQAMAQTTRDEVQGYDASKGAGSLGSASATASTSSLSESGREWVAVGGAAAASFGIGIAVGLIIL